MNVQTVVRSMSPSAFLRVLGLVAALMLPALAGAEPRPEIGAWLATHPVLRVGVVREASPPFDAIGEGDRYEGISADFLALVTQRAGLAYELHFEPSRAVALAKLERGEIDLLPSMYGEPGNRLLLSSAYMQAPAVLIVRRDAPAGATNLAGKKLAMEAGSPILQALQRMYPGAVALEAGDTLAALRAVADGHAYAYVGAYAPASWLAERHSLRNLVVRGPIPFDSDLRFALRRDGAILRDLLDDAIASITPEERDSILRRWMPVPLTLATADSGVVLDEAQRAWIAAHPSIRVGYIADNAPLSEKGPDGQMRGLFADELALLQKRLGLQIGSTQPYTPAGLQAALALGEVDVAFGVHRSGRDEIARFAGPLLTTATVAITRGDAGFFHDPGDYVGQTIAMTRGNALVPRLKRAWPGINVVEYESFRETLNAVARGEAVATLADMAATSGPLSDDYAGVLKIAGAWLSAPSEFQIAVRSDWPELVTLFRQALATMTPAEQHRLEQAWLAPHSELAFPWRKLMTVGLPLLACLIIALGAALVWNRRLRAEVERRAEVEAQLAAARDNALAAADRLTGFLAALSHEIRTPMNGVTGLVDALSHSRLDVDQRYQLGVVARSARMALDILGDALDLAKAEAGRLTLETRPTDPRPLAEDVAALLAPLAAERGLALQLSISPLLPPLDIDGLRVRQIIANLVTNALRYTEQGFVRIRVTGTALSTRSWRLVVEIEDSGPGVPVAMRGRLFQPFQSTSGPGNPGGTGLGLAICKALADAMRGELDWELLGETGSRFRFSLETDALLIHSETDRPFAGVGVRLICGDAFWRTEAGAWLRAWGARVLDATSDEASQVTLSDGAAPLPNQPWVLMTRSSRTTMNRSREGKVVLDAEPLLPGRLREALALALEPAVQEVAAAPRVTTGRKVLVVDDEPLNLRVARELLELLGFDAVTVSESSAGFEQFCAGSFEAILLDYRMPGEDGISLAARMRMRERNRNMAPTPILAVTADGSEVTRSSSIAAGIDSVLLKPLTLDSLYHALAELGCKPTTPAQSETEDEDETDLADPLAHLASLLGSTHRARSIAEGFVAASADDLSALRDKLDVGDVEATRFLAHRIKGGARNAGFERVGAAAADLENAARQSDVNVCRRHAQRLAAALEQLRARLAAIPQEAE
jgi:two-component system sensor histidine kinase EvgS